MTGPAPAPLLYHFSEEPGIEVFAPRLIATRPEVTDPLVWAVEASHQYTYLFPRDCPRVLLWPVDSTTDQDRAAWFGRTQARAIAYLEYAWLERIRTTALYRYALPPETFESLDDAWMWVSRVAVRPLAVDVIDDLFEALRAAGVELRIVDRFAPLYGLWDETTLHWSSIRMRNALDWPSPPVDASGLASAPRGVERPVVGR